MQVKRILHYPGSKWSMAEWIISFFPKHDTYLEPFFGSGAVLFNKIPSKLETINDIDGDVINLFKVIREHPDELAKMVWNTPYSRDEFISSHKPAGNEIERARRFLVRCWQSIRVKTGSISGWRCRSTACDHYRIKQWNELPENINQVAERLKEVQIENRPALQVIERYNREDVLNDHKGPVFLSGYHHELYDRKLEGWAKEERKQVIETGQRRTEVLWINPVAAAQLGQLSIFDLEGVQ